MVTRTTGTTEKDNNTDTIIRWIKYEVRAAKSKGVGSIIFNRIIHYTTICKPLKSITYYLKRIRRYFLNLY